MSKLTPRQLLLRHLGPFLVSFAALTGLLLANYAVSQFDRLQAGGSSAGSFGEFLVLSIPHTVALTIPMAVFVAVSFVFMRLGAEGELASARTDRERLRRLILPVLGAAGVLTALTLVSNTQVVPRANTRLASVLQATPVTDGSGQLSDRMMTVGQLRAAAQSARAGSEGQGSARAVAYEVEIQKKFALAAACLFLALAAMATAIRFPQGGVRLVIAASGAVFTVYLLSLMAGESLADQQLVSPVLAMWLANAVMLAAALVLTRSGRLRREASTPEFG